MRCLALEYHDIIGDDPDASGFPGGAAASYKLGAGAFDAHLAAISRHRPAVASAEDLERGTPGVAVLLTFDDGGVSALTAAAPALARHGWPGHFFIATGRIGTPGFLGREEIVALRQAGHVIGSHSRSHPLRFAELSPEAMRAEWTESRAVLEDTLGTEVRTASIPGGQYSRAAAEAAAAAGYRVLFTSEPVMRTHIVAGCRVVGRYTLRSSSTADTVESLVSGRRRERWRQWTVWNAKKVAKAAGGRAYLALRDRLLERRALA